MLRMRSISPRQRANSSVARGLYGHRTETFGVGVEKFVGVAVSKAEEEVVDVFCVSVGRVRSPARRMMTALGLGWQTQKDTEMRLMVATLSAFLVQLEEQAGPVSRSATM
jgi:hypothetical protein